MVLHLRSPDRVVLLPLVTLEVASNWGLVRRSNLLAIWASYLHHPASNAFAPLHEGMGYMVGCNNPPDVLEGQRSNLGPSGSIHEVAAGRGDQTHKHRCGRTSYVCFQRSTNNPNDQHQLAMLLLFHPSVRLTVGCAWSLSPGVPGPGPGPGPIGISSGVWPIWGLLSM